MHTQKIPHTHAGCIYEYTVEDASVKAAPSLARRTALLQQRVVARAAEMRALALGSKFQKPPGESACALLHVGWGRNWWIFGCAFSVAFSVIAL